MRLCFSWRFAIHAASIGLVIVHSRDFDQTIQFTNIYTLRPSARSSEAPTYSSHCVCCEAACNELRAAESYKWLTWKVKLFEANGHSMSLNASSATLVNEKIVSDVLRASPSIGGGTRMMLVLSHTPHNCPNDRVTVLDHVALSN